MDRRGFLSRIAQGLTIGAASLTGGKAKADAPGYRFLSACLDRTAATGNGYDSALLDGEGRVLLQTTLAMRAHEIALHPTASRCLAVGRQPGRHSTMVDLADGRALHDLAIADDHEFNGHAVFLGDGSEVLATEEHVETSIGHLSFYDSDSGRWLRSWSSQGIEPHEALADASRGRLIVANGGILQRQAVGEVESSLVILDLADGKVATKSMLPDDLATLSMRHIALTTTGEVAFAMQDQDAQSDIRPLVGVMDLQGKLRFLAIPREIALTLRGYVGSVAVDRDSQVVCATSPKGNVAMFWALQDDRWLGSLAIADGCGVAPTGQAGQFMLTGGKGDILLATVLDRAGKPISPRATILAQDARWQWDNHLTLLAA
jgi:hypothetical protein